MNCFQIVWLKKDLRLEDHEPLTLALKEVSQYGKVLLLYCHEPELYKQPDMSRQHFEFTRECLADIQAELANVGGCLHIKQGDFKDILIALKERQLPISRIIAYKETSQNFCFQRDRSIRRWCKQENISFIELDQNGVKRGSDFKEKNNTFEAYLNEILNEDLKIWPPAFLKNIEPSCVWQEWPLNEKFEVDGGFLIRLFSEEDTFNRQKGGLKQANVLVARFFNEDSLTKYPTSISSPLTAVEGCSRLSPYLTHGVISQKQLVHQIKPFLGQKKASISKKGGENEVSEGVRFFLERLYWRVSFIQRFELDPSIETQSKDRLAGALRIDEFDEDLFEAWKAGMTGVPFVDACMRMLRQTGWINMRMRGMLMSFACNELWLDWRLPGLFLAKQFLDYEPGIHWHQMQIHGGTYPNTWLMYNPIKQAKIQDPQGVFTRKWVPELKELPAEALHEPWNYGVLLPDYLQKPVVPLEISLECARITLENIKAGKPAPLLSYSKQRRENLRKKKQSSLF